MDRERECRNPVRERQLCSGDVGFVTWRSSSFAIVVKVLENTEFTDVRPLFPPLMHAVCLVYSNSAYYSSAARIIVLMQVQTAWIQLSNFVPYFFFVLLRGPRTQGRSKSFSRGG